jgi:hypothetical protein
LLHVAIVVPALFSIFFYALNFLAFGAFSLLNNCSAPTFLPLLGQPYFGLKTLHDVVAKARKPTSNMILPLRMGEMIYT